MTETESKDQPKAAPEPAPEPEPESDEGLFWGRPPEDRAFEAVEIGAGALTGAAIGTVVAGPIGTAVGGIVGGAAGLLAGEALERHEGQVAKTTDATEHVAPPQD